jgi:hypothetical protein
MNRHKLSPEVVVAIRTDVAAGMTPKLAASKYGLAWSTVHGIITGRSHADAGGPLRAKRARISADATAEELHAEARRRLLERSRFSDNGCWHWTGPVSPAGYASMHFGGKYGLVHRLSYEVFVGPIPDGHVVDHQCHSLDLTCFAGDACMHRRCLRPDHLAPLSRVLNVQLGRGWAVHGLKTECPRGHPYDEDNTKRKLLPSGGWGRICRECERTYYRRKRDALAGGEPTRHAARQPRGPSRSALTPKSL